MAKIDNWMSRKKKAGYERNWVTDGDILMDRYTMSNNEPGQEQTQPKHEAIKDKIDTMNKTRNGFDFKIKQ